MMLQITNLDTGVLLSWYRKQIKIPENIKNTIWQLYFEGVNISCDVYVNGKQAGGHIGGYVGFNVDITPYIKAGQMNEILVKADNSINRDIIPSQKSDFFIFGGITRDVWLEILPTTYISGLRVQTPTVTEKEASTIVLVDIHNSKTKKDKAAITLELIDPSGKKVAQKKVDKFLNPGINNYIIPLESILKPRLWSPDSPVLYQLKASLSGNSQDQIILNDLDIAGLNLRKMVLFT